MSEQPTNTPEDAIAALARVAQRAPTATPVLDLPPVVEPPPVVDPEPVFVEPDPVVIEPEPVAEPAPVVIEPTPVAEPDPIVVAAPVAAPSAPAKPTGPAAAPKRLGLWIGAGLLVLATIYVVHDAGSSSTPFWVCARNIVAGIAVALVANFLIKRHRDKSTKWNSFSFETADEGAMALGGIVALILALAFGAPSHVTASSALATAQSCNQTSPIESLPTGQVKELSPNQLAAVFGPDADGLSLFGTAYGVGSRGDQAVVFTVADSGGTGGALQGFAAAKQAAGFSAMPAKIGGNMATRFDSPSGNQTAFSARTGCYDVMVLSPSASSATHWASALLATK